MNKCFYSGSVPMKPEMDKMDFFGEYIDYDISYQMPKIYFECAGDTYDSKSSLEWSDNSLIVVKDNCIVKYTESKFSDVLVKDVDGKSDWLECRVANVYGFEEEDVEDSVERKRYTVEEYDLDKSEKRSYSVILKTSSQLNDIDKSIVQDMIDNVKKHGISNYVLTENY